MRTTNSGNPPINPDESSAPNLERRSDGQHKDHWVLSDDERAKGFIRPVRQVYKHLVCGTETRMPLKIAETYAVNPHFYGATFCAYCGDYTPVGEFGKFIWLDDNSKVGT